MKTVLSSHWTKLLAGLVVALSLSPSAQAAPAPPVDDNIQNYLQLLRSDFNSGKVDLVNRIMRLSAPEAKKFWPIYREYENELGKQSIKRAEFIAEFVQYHKDGARATVLADAWAKDMAQRWFKAQRARLDLLEEYHGKIEKALSALQAGQFLQIEHQIGLFIDVTIAAEMPLLGENIK